MPICRYGGAKCCAGPIEVVEEHEVQEHGKKARTSRGPCGPTAVITRRRGDEAMDFLYGKYRSMRHRTGRYISAQRKHAWTQRILAIYYERIKRGY